MELYHLDAKTIHSAFLTACNAIIINREHLNTINLFPVADGDTGDNMSATALSVIRHSSIKITLNETFQSLASAALLGARGNSGMIFSQFFNGLTETHLTSEQLDTKTFAQLISKASQSVRSAIVHPLEGTIITVIDAWSTSINKFAQEVTCFKTLIKHTLSETDQALQSTSTMLPILKEAQLVDAGALGFYHFINGFASYLENPQSLNTQNILECDHAHHEPATDGLPPKQRYCTEIMLSGESINRLSIAHQLEQFGDSIVSSGNATLSRFHVHCTEPDKVFESLFNAGQIVQAKAEDMLRQYEMIHQRKYPIALVTDSSADLPQSILDENQIHIIQLNMHLDGHNLIDRICISQKTFYDLLASLTTYPKTSFPSPAILQEKIHHLAKHYEQVLVISISKALSGAHDALVNAAKPFSNVHVINSRQTSAGLGLLVHYAAQLITQGLTVDEIKNELELKIPKINLFVYVENCDSLIRSGRVSKLGGRIAQFAHLKPLIKLNESGNGVLFDKAFSEIKALSKLVNHVDTLSKDQVLESYGLVHAGNPEKALEFSQLTSEAFGQPPAFIEYVSSALGLHAGKGAIGIASMMK